MHHMETEALDDSDDTQRVTPVEKDIQVAVDAAIIYLNKLKIAQHHPLTLISYLTT